MIKTSIVIIIYCITLSSSLFAQRNFQPAVIISNAGDTLRGEINYQKWERNPRQISFRQSEASTVTQYDATTIAGFTVEGDIYKSAAVDIDSRYDDVKRLSNTSDIILARDTVFLRVLVAGSKPLYHYYDNVDHFYIETNNAVELLQFKKYRVLDSGGATGASIRNNRQYRAQLSRYLHGCSSINDNLARTNYDAGSLMKAISSYYKCTSTQPAHIQEVENPKFNIGLLAGLSHSTLKISKTNPPIMSSLKYPSSTDFAGGVYFDLVFPRNRGRVSLNNELLFTTYNTEAAYTYQTATTLDIYTYRFGYSYIKMNNMFRYRFLQGTTSLYLNAGITNGIVINEKNTLTHYHKVATERTTVETGLKDARNHEFGFVAGIGAKRKRAGFELRADRSNGMAPYTISKSSVMRYFALVSYSIN